ncbi:F-box protein SKIP14-like isoform X1 [Cynara cardunculus var. scolymus]|uniref:F-box protein SKIP14-like isoform X1 n=2 Tax=Cynara cardunculus var. scolymus TaxID=59895 RepID=UPI000D62D43C|nr:F-box protein SKIP14-like isoform X1 [Cynara cardunculus var. scolymus]
MADDFFCDPKVSMFSSMKIGDWYRMDDYGDTSYDDGCGDYLNLNWEWKEVSEIMSHSQDVVDVLPSDPFEMNINGGCTMIRGWIEEVDDDDDDDDDDGIGCNTFRNRKDESDGLFSGLNLVWTETMRPIDSINNGCHDDDDGGDHDHDLGSPPDALFFALGYLGMRDLLSVERVCKSLRDGVRNDPLLWRSIEIDQPSDEMFSDESLLRMTNRANESLQSLSLVKCSKITDNGLKTVFQRNPGLTKLSVLGCNGLSVEGLLNNLKFLKSTGGTGIKRLRIGGLHTVTTEQYEELKKALSSSLDNEKQLGYPKPRFYHGGQLYLSLDDNRPIDIEACPKCHQIRQIYDCPAEICQLRRVSCRACTFCIPRCINCGCCFNERDYMETFCLDFLCLDCLAQILSFPDGEEEDMSIPPGFHPQASYHFCLYG